MKLAALLLLVAVGCSNQVELVADREPVTAAALPAACVPPQFAPGECYPETFNDGTGPSDHRTTCRVGGEWWALYPSGETWHWRDPDGKSDPAFCHVAASGVVLWPQ